MNTDWSTNEEIQIFQEYLRIPTVHPDVNYEPCIEFLKHQAENLNLCYVVYRPGGIAKPIIVIKWEGTQTELPAIMLNSHMDVVPVYDELWTHSPFAAHIDMEGRIFARGTQDMKCSGMQYLAAIRAMKHENVRLKRNVFVTFVPDEEIGSVNGLIAFVKTAEFTQMNVGFSMDEGMASESEKYFVYYTERAGWHVTFKILGPSGDGSLLIKNTAAEKFQYLLNKFMDFREGEAKLLENNAQLTIADVSSVNLTMISSVGVPKNVIPPEMKMHFDIRISANTDHDELEMTMRRWMEEAGGDIELIFDSKFPYVPPTQIVNNLFVEAFEKAANTLGIKIEMRVFAAATDNVVMRQIGIPAIGFSAINWTPVLLHAHDEFIRADTYLRGIDIWKQIIFNVANS